MHDPIISPLTHALATAERLDSIAIAYDIQRCASLAYAKVRSGFVTTKGITHEQYLLNCLVHISQDCDSILSR